MNALRFLRPTASWFLRTALVFFFYVQYFDVAMSFRLKNLMFYIAAVFIVGGIVLFVGGFLRNARLTVTSAFVLLLAAISRLIVCIESGGMDYNFAAILLVSAGLLHFVANGNKY